MARFLATLVLCFTLPLAGLASGRPLPKPEVEGFYDNPDGKTSTLRITCPNGSYIEITVDRKRLDMMDVDAIYAFLYFHCKDK